MKWFNQDATEATTRDITSDCRSDTSSVYFQSSEENSFDDESIGLSDKIEAIEPGLLDDNFPFENNNAKLTLVEVKIPLDSLRYVLVYSLI